jgi:hypothetical protein
MQTWTLVRFLLGLVPGEPFETRAAVIMLTLAASVALAVTIFRRRDLTAA